MIRREFDSTMLPALIAEVGVMEAAAMLQTPKIIPPTTEELRSLMTTYRDDPPMETSGGFEPAQIFQILQACDETIAGSVLIAASVLGCSEQELTDVIERRSLRPTLGWVWPSTSEFHFLICSV